MRSCTECGAVIASDASVCPECGSAQPERPRRSRPSTPLLITLGSGALGLLLAGGVAAFLLLGRTGTGVLVGLTTGQPVAGASIRTAAGVVVTDAAGRFTLPKLRFGTHPVTVTATGFAPFRTSVRMGAFSGGESRLSLPDAAALVRMEEVALQPKTVGAAKVLVGGKTASAAASGTYEIKGLPPGPATITVTTPSHETTKTTVRLKPGANEVTVRVNLTPAETYTRYFEAYKSGRWQLAYSYLHPDVAKRESLATYIKDMQDWGKPVSISMQGTRMLGAWTSPYTNASYGGVAEIRRSLLTEKGGVRIQSALPQHWVNVGGLWLRVDL